MLSRRNETPPKKKKERKRFPSHKALDKETHLERRKLAWQLFGVGVGEGWGGTEGHGTPYG